MYFEGAANEFNRVLDEECIDFSEKFRKTFLNIMSEMCNYSEEDHRIRPQVILGTDLKNYFDTVTPKNYFVMYRDDLSGGKLPRYFKSLALFCDNGWYIVVNKVNEQLEYGIFRSYVDIAGIRFEDFFRNSFDEMMNGHMIVLKAINNSDILITRYKEAEVLISQKFVAPDGKSQEEEYSKLADDVIEECDERNKAHLKACFMKMFRNFPQKVHGTIMLVVEDSFIIPKNNLAGIQIEPPIDFDNIFTVYKEIDNYKDAESVYSLTGILYEMLNTDGITIITNKGRILFYNVFYEGKIPKDIKGGARKRTAQGILKNKKLQGILGVYFQSQDGDIIYERRQK